MVGVWLGVDLVLFLVVEGVGVVVVGRSRCMGAAFGALRRSSRSSHTDPSLSVEKPKL